MRIAAIVLALLIPAAAARADKAPAAPAPAAPTGPACRAFDGTKQIADSKGETASDCAFNLRDTVKAYYCKAGSKGKTFKFVVKYDHKLGARSWPDSKDSMYCATEQ